MKTNSISFSSPDPGQTKDPEGDTQEEGISMIARVKLSSSKPWLFLITLNLLFPVETILYFYLSS